ncbi:MAG: cytochrome b N-terminal domain-containing protein [Fimbriimonadaceae bacterium]
MNRSSMWAASAAAIVIQFVLQSVIGLGLQTIYVPNLAGAHPTVEEIRTGSLTALWQGVHYWGSQILILHCFLHLAMMVWSGRYKYRLEFLGICLLFLSAFLFQVTGNALPMDRHDVQTVVIEAGIGRSMPVVGEWVGQMILQGDRFNQDTLTTWFDAHRYLVVGLMVFGLIVFLAGRKGRGEKGSLFAMLVPLVAVFVLAWLVKPPAGEQGVLADFDATNALVGWYTWPLHGALKAFSAISPSLGWVGAGVLPGLFAAFLAILVVMGSKFDVSKARIGFGAFVLVFLGAALLFGGRFAPLTGNQDPPKLAEVKRADIQPIDNALAAKGELLFANAPCAGCHGPKGAGGTGPSLLTVFKKYPNADWYKRFIKNPASVKPGTVMPAFPDLSEADLSALAEFLRKPK